MSSIDDRTPQRVTAAIRARWQKEPAGEAASVPLPTEDPALDEAITKLAEDLGTGDSGRVQVDPARQPPTMITSGGVDEAKAYVAPIDAVEHPAAQTLEVAKVRIGAVPNPRHLPTEVIERPARSQVDREGSRDGAPVWVKGLWVLVGALAVMVAALKVVPALLQPQRAAPARSALSAIPAPVIPAPSVALPVPIETSTVVAPAPVEVGPSGTALPSVAPAVTAAPVLVSSPPVRATAEPVPPTTVSVAPSVRASSTSPLVSPKPTY